MSLIFRPTEETEEIYTILSKKLATKCSSKFCCKMLCWNVRSILNDEKRNNVLQVLEDYQIQIACITETWFDSKNGKFTADIKEAGYELAHDFRDGQRGGGTAILYKNNLNVKPGVKLAHQNFRLSNSPL